ncbi:MFS transporter permease [Massilia sp. Root351]|uniref:MFS transporter n=1 Tax=Massilia sp. Root351 TaxID=1736522 RepID=UPI00070E1420|nr:MFS transporter [Massilia sp. Root351]KQV85259.1 MFS transporter permease [Massilia sp. Root351]
MRSPDTAVSGIFHGWIVVAAAFVVTFVGFGSAYSFASFLAAFQAEFGASRGSVSLVFSLAGFLYFALGPISGPLADRWGVRVLTAAGMALVGLGLILAGRASTLMQVYLAYGLGVGLGVGCAYVPALGAVQRWFVQRRGLASGLAVSGIGVGTLVLPPLATWLIAQLEWRNAYLVLGVLAVVLGGAAAWFMEGDPASRGLHPDGQRPAAGSVPRRQEGLSVREAMRTRPFRGLYIACLVGSLGVFVPFVHLLPYAVEHGVPATAAAWLLGAIGVGSTAGRFLLGGMADKVGRERFLIAMHLGMAAALAIWAASGTWLALAAFALVFGLFYGGWVAVLPAVVADLFGAKHVGAVIGVLYTSVAIGTLAGPSSAGFLHDVLHDDLLTIIACSAANVIAAAVLAVMLKKPLAGAGPGS